MTVADLLDRAPELPSAWDELDHRLIVEGECWHAAGYAALPGLAELAHRGGAESRDRAVRLAALIVRTLHRCVGFDHLVRAAAGHLAVLHATARARVAAV